MTWYYCGPVNLIVADAVGGVSVCVCVGGRALVLVLAQSHNFGWFYFSWNIVCVCHNGAYYWFLPRGILFSKLDLFLKLSSSLPLHFNNAVMKRASLTR